MNADSEIDRLYEELRLVKLVRPALAVEYYGLTERIVGRLNYKHFSSAGKFGRKLTFNDCFEYQYRSRKNGNEEIYFKPGTTEPEGWCSLVNWKAIYRQYGPAYTNRAHRVEIWIKDGIVDRNNGPAITHGNNRLWVRDGYLHRLGGPAVDTEFSRKQYWINGQEMSPKDYKQEIERRIRKGQLNGKQINEIRA